MKRILIPAALVLGAALTQQAVACDLIQREATAAQTASACEGSGCTPAPTAQQTPAAAQSTAATTVVDEPAPSAPMTVACQGNAC